MYCVVDIRMSRMRHEHTNRETESKCMPKTVGNRCCECHMELKSETIFYLSLNVAHSDMASFGILWFPYFHAPRSGWWYEKKENIMNRSQYKYKHTHTHTNIIWFFLFFQGNKEGGDIDR